MTSRKKKDKWAETYYDFRECPVEGKYREFKNYQESRFRMAHKCLECGNIFKALLDIFIPKKK
jgi:hypothetical protein